MLIGIMGDTHDHIPHIRSVVEMLTRLEADVVLHAGDYIAPFVIPELARIPAPVIGVFGNNDGDRPFLEARCRESKTVDIRGYFVELTFEGERVALLHGHERDLLAWCRESGRYDLVVSGHTHTASVSRRESTVCVNPGEVCGYLTGVPSFAIYRTGERDARILTLEKGGR
ncbi:MAG: metallophosphoesterase [Methanolinea sp.]|nr:metallophosphoesterase [Methanolinea sp.]